MSNQVEPCENCEFPKPNSKPNECSVKHFDPKLCLSLAKRLTNSLVFLLCNSEFANAFTNGNPSWLGMSENSEALAHCIHESRYKSKRNEMIARMFEKCTNVKHDSELFWNLWNASTDEKIDGFEQAKKREFLANIFNNKK